MPVDLELSGVPPPSLRAGAPVTVSDGTVHLDDGTLVGALPADRVASLAGRTGRVRSVRRGDAPAVVVRFDEPAAVATAPARAAAPVVPPPRGLNAAAEAALDPDELGCRLTRQQFDALVASPDLRSLLRDPAARASAEAVLAAPNPAAALETATARGGSLAPLSDAVLDAVAPDEKA